MFPRRGLAEHHPGQVRPKHHHQRHGGKNEHRHRQHGPPGPPPHLFRAVQCRGVGQPGDQHQIQRPQKDSGQGQHGQGHPAHHAELRHGRRPVHAALHKLLWDKGGVHRRHQITQQGGGPHRDGDGGHPPGQSPAPLPRPRPADPRHPPAVEHCQRHGGKDLTNHHAGDDQPHRPLWVLGQKQHQQPQHRRRPDELLHQLHDSRRADHSGPIEKVLVDVLHPGESHAGQQQDQPQLGPGIPQQIDRDGVIEGHHCRRYRQEPHSQGGEAHPPGLRHSLSVSQGQILGAEVGHGCGQPHSGEGQQYRAHRHQQLIQPHHLRPHQPGQGHPVTERQPL